MLYNSGQARIQEFSTGELNPRPTDFGDLLLLARYSLFSRISSSPTPYSNSHTVGGGGVHYFVCWGRATGRPLLHPWLRLSMPGAATVTSGGPAPESALGSGYRNVGLQQSEISP
jgi:hypothetical protein